MFNEAAEGFGEHVFLWLSLTVGVSGTLKHGAKMTTKTKVIILHSEILIIIIILIFFTYFLSSLYHPELSFSGSSQLPLNWKKQQSLNEGLIVYYFLQ